MGRQGIGEDLLVQAGLILSRQNQPGFYDRFRGRLLFPIRDVQGRVVAFGGRALSGEEPKYLNSPETPLYVKGQVLYALDVAQERDPRAEPGASSSRATSTASWRISTASARRWPRSAPPSPPPSSGCCAATPTRSLALFDADAAGQKASSRLEEMMNDVMDLQNLGWSVARTGGFEKAGHLPIRVALLPPGHDPDSLLRAEGPAALNAMLDAARPPALVRAREGARRGGPGHPARAAPTPTPGSP